MLIVALGANDGLRGLSGRGNEAEPCDRSSRRPARTNVIVILAGMEAPPNYGVEYATSFRQAYPRPRAEIQACLSFHSCSTRSPDRPALNQGDGIIPTSRGAAIVADTVWNVLKPLLDQISVS